MQGGLGRAPSCGLSTWKLLLPVASPWHPSTQPEKGATPARCALSVPRRVQKALQVLQSRCVYGISRAEQRFSNHPTALPLLTWSSVFKPDRDVQGRCLSVPGPGRQSLSILGYPVSLKDAQSWMSEPWHALWLRSPPSLLLAEAGLGRLQGLEHQSTGC